MGALGDNPSGGFVKHDGEKSSRSHGETNAGSDRPGKVAVKIDTSMEGVDPHTLSRAPKDWLK